MNRRDYFVRLEGQTRFRPVAAEAPIQAATTYSGRRGLKEGSIVEVKTAGAKVRRYQVGSHPRSVAIVDVRGTVLS